VAKDSAEAVRWWLQSAQNGIAEAQNRMGYLYEYGLGVPQDFREAARYFNSAAEQKLAVSEYNLGHMYQYGQGVQQDLVSALMWFTLAAAKGDAEAKKRVEIVGMSMDPPQILEAKRRAAEWAPAKALK